MRRIVVMSLFGVFAGSTLLAQTATTPPPQTARQALIEMFMGTAGDSFSRHLPESARKTLVHNGDEPSAFSVLQIPMFGHQMILRGEHVQTFDTGPTILVNDRSQNERAEVTVERDGYVGETEEIELSFHFYRDGQEQWLAMIPRFTFALMQQKGIWRLADFTVAARMPLADAHYIHGMREQQMESNESAAQMRIGSILSAESGYADRHPDLGFACDIATLFTPEAAEDTPDDTPPPPTIYDPGAGSPDWSGYRFKLTGCEGTPASKYQITAVPLDSDSGVKTFCADESATVRAVAGGKHLPASVRATL